MKLHNIYHRLKFRFVIQHLVFWLISIVLFTVLVIFTRDFRIQELNFGIALSIFITIFFLAVAVYIHLWWLIPTFLQRKRFFMFFLLEAGNIVFFIFLNYYVSWFFEKAHPEFFSEAIAEFLLVLIFLVVATLLKFMRDSMVLQDITLKMRELEKQSVETELRALKSQINPHFFFNTLNSLYSLSLDKSDRTPELILKLSDLMRYVLYESGDHFVPLRKQVEFIENFIFLEKIRLGENAKVTIEIIGDCENKMIAPLIFIPFIENAFKHGVKSKLSDAWVNIRMELKEEGKTLVFSVENNKENSGNNDHFHKGIGLENVRKQLNIQYPGKHRLVIKDEPDRYDVELIIEIA